MIDGTEQRDRLLPVLKEGYFDVEELQFEQFVAMSASLASKLAYYDLDNKTEYDAPGNNADSWSWAGLFRSDEALVLAQIINRNLEPERAVAMRERAADQASALRELEHDLKRWCNALADTDYGQPVSDLIEQLLEQNQPATEDGNERARFLYLVASLTRIQQLSRVQLVRSFESRSHDPATGLLIAFLQLYSKTQKQINRFADRHVDFYYHDCLHLQPRPGVPESVHLICERDTATPEVEIRRGTEFIAPRGLDGQEVLCSADEDVVVTDAKVSALAEIRLERDKLISPEGELNYVTRVKQTWHDGDGAASRTASSQPQTIFGGTGQEDNAPTTEDARIGLAIASPILFLKEGSRDIRITLWLENAAETDLDALTKIEAPAQGRIELEEIFERYLALERKLLTAEEISDRSLAQRLADAAKSRLPPKNRRSDSDPGFYYDVFLTELFLLEPQDEETLTLRAGRLFSRWLLTKWNRNFDWLNDEELKRVRDQWLTSSQFRKGKKLDLGKPGRFDITSGTALRLLGRTKPTAPESDDREQSSLDPLSLFRAKGKPQREAIFNVLLNNIFEVSLTTETGWYKAENALVVRPQPRQGRSRSGLEILVSLKPDVAPIIGYRAELHGENWSTSLPVVRISLRSDAGLYPYSLFEDVVLGVIDLSVEVEGVRDAVVASDLGMLDPSKPFSPFGPLPRVGSYFTVGSPEIACKNPASLKINLEWGGLPQNSGGFSAYYREYDSTVDSNQIFKAAVSVLRDGSWQPQATNGQTLSLFQSEEVSGKIANQSVLTVDERILRSHFRGSAATLTADGPELAHDAVNGLVRLQLTEPAHAFGHQEYPSVVSRAAKQSLKRMRKREQRNPNPPYTPVVQRISIDYRAEASIRLDVEPGRKDADAGEKVFHVHPFGIDQIFPGREVSPPLMPRYQSGGNLFIGLRAADLKGNLTILFHFRDIADVLRIRPERRFEWAFLVDNQWKRLESQRILSDTTQQFVTSGIVTIDVPGEITSDNTILPAGLFWLRISDRTAFDAFDALYSVQAQAVKATRIGSGADSELSRHGTAMLPVTSLPGLLGVTQIGDAFGVRPAESQERMRARVGERLRHKNRAQTPWDYERLVLERFPEVMKAKCFMSTNANSGSRDKDEAAADDAVPPGNVVIVVLPKLQTAPTFERGVSPGLNNVQLLRIEEYLQSAAPPSCRIAVSNPVYERIQVRCTVRLMPGCPVGISVKRIEQSIAESISPWNDRGYSPSRFAWSILAEDIEAWIGNLDCVESVAQLALIQIVADDKGFHVFNARDERRVTPMLPGSIAIPTNWHIIHLADDTAADAAKNTGITHMKLGDTFIIGGLGKPDGSGSAEGLGDGT
jgi:hypothetical protein